jgi:hypothetical protein
MRLVLILALLALTLPRAASAAPRGPRFDPQKIGVVEKEGLRVLVASRPKKAAFGPRALRQAGRSAVELARRIALLMPSGPAGYKKVLIGPSNVALLRKDGVVEIIRRTDAEVQIASGKTLERVSVQVGIHGPGFPLLAEAGPGATLCLYRQLPKKARGEVASTFVHTSFALGAEDAYHPFGQAGKTVRIAVPRALFDDAVEGRAGAVGWNNLGDGYSTGLEVETEIQIPSSSIRSTFGR